MLHFLLPHPLSVPQGRCLHLSSEYITESTPRRKPYHIANTVHSLIRCFQQVYGIHNTNMIKQWNQSPSGLLLQKTVECITRHTHMVANFFKGNLFGVMLIEIFIQADKLGSTGRLRRVIFGLQ